MPAPKPTWHNTFTQDKHSHLWLITSVFREVSEKKAVNVQKYLLLTYLEWLAEGFVDLGCTCYMLEWISWLSTFLGFLG